MRVPVRVLVCLGWSAILLIAGCASRGEAAGAPAAPAPRPGSPRAQGPGEAPPAAPPGTDSLQIVTPQLLNAIHDLKRLHIVTEVRDAGESRLALILGDQALVPGTALAFELERLYVAYRYAADVGDAVVLELWDKGRKVGRYTNEGLLLTVR